MEIADRYVFSCTNCGKKVPWPLSKSDIGIADWKDPDHGSLYPFEKCWCGWGKFVRCTDQEAAPETERKAGIEVEIKKKIDHAKYAKLSVKDIHPNPKQPRRFFDKVALQSLADSIATVGLLEDILVRIDTANGGYEIVLGERRWRATQLAGFDTISSKVADLTVEEAKLLSIVENVQREDLTDVEEAFSFKSYIDDGMSVAGVGSAMGKLDGRVATKLKTLSSHYFIKFQEDRLQELTQDNENLKAELSSLHNQNGRYTTQIIKAKGELTEVMNDGWEFVTQLSDGDFLVRKK